MYLTTSAADFSKENLVVKGEETHDAGVFGRVEAEVVKLLGVVVALGFETLIDCYYYFGLFKTQLRSALDFRSAS